MTESIAQTLNEFTFTPGSGGLASTMGYDGDWPYENQRVTAWLSDVYSEALGAVEPGRQLKQVWLQSLNSSDAGCAAWRRSVEDISEQRGIAPADNFVQVFRKM